MGLIRKENWPLLLHEFVIEYEKKEFSWGKTDCCTMMFDWVERCTGVDLSTPYKGKYTTKTGAFRLMKRLHNGKVAESVNECVSRAGVIETKPLMTQRGDIVVVNELQADGTFDDVGGVCIGLYVIVLSDKKGLHKLPLTSIKRSWKI